MITLNIGKTSVFDSKTNSFKTLPGGKFRFENSLRAIAKWESKWLIRFLPNIKNLTHDQLVDYCYCMCVDDDFDYAYLSSEVVSILIKYINRKSSTLSFHSQKNTSSEGPRYCNEIIYAQMTLANIPFECDQWNIERLLNLLNCIHEMTSPKPKKSKAEIAREMSELNAQRLKEYNTRG